MEGLVVVHPEMGYLDPAEMGEEAIRNNRRLFKNIAVEIDKYLKTGNRVYYLAEESDSLDSELIYPAIRKHLPETVYIPCDITEKQFLILKELLIHEGLDRIVICGVAYECCVKDLYYLLLGEGGSGPFATKRDYEEESRELGWSKKSLKKCII